MKGKELNATEFKEKIFDYSTATEWEFKGKRPAVIDFYADWCGPCKMVAPIMEELAKDYDGKVDIYKVDTQVEQELAGVFRIMSIPSVLFIPMTGKPIMQAGALNKSLYEKVIEEELLKNPVVEN